MSFPPSHPALDRALAARGYAEPTPVQRAVLEDGNPAADLLVSAQTGSGKTVAFGLSMATTLLGEAERFDRAGAPLALIIAPTRELAMQIIRELDWLYAETGARIAQAVGGMSARDEQRRLNAGAHIVVGTPGRLRDHVERGYLNLSELKVAVLDEADEMLDLGFREELEFILDATPAERRTLLFSATIAKDIAVLAKDYQRDAIRIDTTNRSQPHGDIEYRAIRIAPLDIERGVVNVLRYFDAPSALVFCQTREAVRHLHSALLERGFLAVGLSGELSQRERDAALQSLRDGRARVCVATDVAARGLDLPDLGVVIHADIPSNKATLLHRSGRTGRAGRKGVSVLMVPHTRRRKAEMILNSAGVDAKWQAPPTAAEIRTADRERLLNNPSFTEQVSEEDLELGRAILEKYPAEQVAAMLMRIHRDKLPEPENVSDDTRMRDAQARELSSGRRERDRPERGARDEGRPERGERPERKPREPRVQRDDTTWFQLNVGRQRNADPKWLVPLICRLGQVTKADIGSIRIFDGETKFEIIGEAVAPFTLAAERTLEDETRIRPSTAPGPNEHTPMRDRPARPPRDRDSRPAREASQHEDRTPRGRWTPDDGIVAEAAPAPERAAAETYVAPAAEFVVQNVPVAEQVEPRREYKPREDRPREDRQHSDKPRFDKPRGDRPNRDAPHARADKPRFDKKREDHPREDRPREDRPRSDAPRGDKPRFDGAKRPDFKKRDGDKPAFKPRGDRPFERKRDDRPTGERPAFDRKREDRPREDRPREDRPRDDRPGKSFGPRKGARAAAFEAPRSAPRPAPRADGDSPPRRKEGPFRVVDGPAPMRKGTKPGSGVKRPFNSSGNASSDRPRKGPGKPGKPNRHRP